jgi:pyruvate dehydrogenase E2 component (dihydrolipoamide acetyltransferase)
VGSDLCIRDRIGAAGAAAPAPPPEPPTLPAADAAMEPAIEEADEEDDDEPLAAPAEAAVPAGNGETFYGHTFISPVVARIAATHGIDPLQIEGTGRGGRVTKKDILAFVEDSAKKAEETPPPVAPPAPDQISTPLIQAQPAQPRPAPPPTPISPEPVAVVSPEPEAAGDGELEPGETIEPLSAMRRGIAEHMRRSLDTAAHVTSAIEVDMSNVVRIREELKKDYQASYGVNPTYLAFIARAVVETVRDWPWVNAELRGESIITRNYVNLGFAVALEGGKGLIVPVLKHAEGLNLLGMAHGIADLAERARTKKLLPDDVQGGTFSITNPGSFGTFMGTPIISQPQSAILGTYAVVKRPWVIQDDAGQDAIAIRPIMNLTLTYDHRLVDGAYGAQFLRDLAQRLQTWGESDY